MAFNVIKLSDHRAPHEADAAAPAPAPARASERLIAARNAANFVIDAALTGADVPDVVRELLTGPWVKHLELTHARNGAESGEWETATAIVAELILVTDRALNPADPLGAATRLAQIELELDLGLAMTGMREADRRELLGRLHASCAMQRPPMEDWHATSPSHDEDTMRVATDPAVHLDSARRLRVGSWIDFHSLDGHTVRAKLCWASAATGRRLFVDRNGLKIAEKTVHELAAEFMAGLASVV